MAGPALVGCGSSATSEWPKGNVVLKDTNNYTAQASLTIQTVETAPGADLMICWDKIMKDLLCHPLDTSAIDDVGFAKIPMTTTQVEQKLAVGQLDPNLVVYKEHQVAKPETCTMLSTFKFGGDSTIVNPTVDYAEDSTKTYMLLFQNGLNPAINVKSMTFIKPTAGNTNTKVDAPDTCSQNVLDFSATLGQPINIPKAGPWLVDWSQVTKDAFGNKINFLHLDKVEVGFYQGKTAADVQAAFKDIEVNATALYTVMPMMGQRDVDLKDAKDTSGTAFPGFDHTDGVYLVAVLSSTSQTPAPVVLSILTPQ